MSSASFAAASISGGSCSSDKLQRQRDGEDSDSTASGSDADSTEFTPEEQRHEMDTDITRSSHSVLTRSAAKNTKNTGVEVVRMSFMRLPLERAMEPLSLAYNNEDTATKCKLVVTTEERETSAATNNSLLFGEILPRGVEQALSPELLDGGNARVLYDMGAGAGKVAMQSFLQYPNLRTVVGIEFAKSRWEIGAKALKRLAERLQADPIHYDNFVVCDSSTSASGNKQKAGDSRKLRQLQVRCFQSQHAESITLEQTFELVDPDREEQKMDMDRPTGSSKAANRASSSCFPFGSSKSTPTPNPPSRSSSSSQGVATYHRLLELRRGDVTTLSGAEVKQIDIAFMNINLIQLRLAPLLQKFQPESRILTYNNVPEEYARYFTALEQLSNPSSSSAPISASSLTSAQCPWQPIPSRRIFVSWSETSGYSFQYFLNRPKRE